MESFRHMIEQIVERARLLETSQKVAIGLCLAVIVGSMVSLLRWSGTPVLVPVTAEDFTFDELDAAEEALDSEGIRYEQSGRRLLVREQDRYSAIRVLNKKNALPEDFEFGFAKLLESDTTFMPSAVQEHQRQVALGYELAKVIASSPAIQDAFVLIQHQSKRSIGQPRVEPSASIKITMSGGRPVTQTVVDGCARLVATAVPGLSPDNVTVFDTRTVKAHKVPDPDELLEIGLLNERKRNEDRLQAKVLAHLSYIPGALVSVAAELDGSKSRTEYISYGDAEVKSEETKSSRSGETSSPGEPGVNPNTGVALSGAGGGSQSETEENRTENFAPQPTEKRWEDKVPFALKRATAAISIPRSYLVGVCKLRHPDQTEFRDTDAAFTEVRDTEFARAHDAVMNIIPAKADSDVRVDMYYDMEPVGGFGPGVPGAPQGGGEGGVASAMSTGRMLRTYAPQVGLAALALTSLAMMMMMVRKTTRTARSTFPAPSEEPSDDFAIASDGVLSVPGGPVGSAEVSDGFLVGREVDAKTLQNSQIDEQVARLVDDDPETVADMLRRWVDQEE